MIHVPESPEEKKEEVNKKERAVKIEEPKVKKETEENKSNNGKQKLRRMGSKIKRSETLDARDNKKPAPQKAVANTNIPPPMAVLKRTSSSSERTDAFGNLIRIGGNHRISFRDQISHRSLNDFMNIKVYKSNHSSDKKVNKSLCLINAEPENKEEIIKPISKFDENNEFIHGKLPRKDSDQEKPLIHKKKYFNFMGLEEKEKKHAPGKIKVIECKDPKEKLKEDDEEDTKEDKRNLDNKDHTTCNHCILF